MKWKSAESVVNPLLKKRWKLAELKANVNTLFVIDVLFVPWILKVEVILRRAYTFIWSLFSMYTLLLKGYTPN